jgi:hypothetical protein
MTFVRLHKELGKRDRDACFNVIAVIRSKGSDTDNVRDAAHEASHAIQHRLRRWDRRLVDLHMGRMRPRPRLRSEAIARAVEQLVCRELGVPYEPKEWHRTAVLEAGITYPDLRDLDIDTFSEMVDDELYEATAQAIAKRIVRMGR